ncbi:hypothetical protein A0H81_08776 [Grifola frondosa]|uniref:Uncharacterized protein n=1 Tax=Grifola frondosa TaxID=5627 RepID=A0A1C7M8P8_GRIFR|nr:hypothetical protein A0H81_08776 [Grifola frondosa]
MNIVDMILTGTQSFRYVVDYFVNPMTSILVSRFILNLRAIDSSGNSGADTSRPSVVGSLRFAEFAEPLGAPLDHGVSLSVHEYDFPDEELAGEEMAAGGTQDDMELGQTSVDVPWEAEGGPSGAQADA